MAGFGLLADGGERPTAHVANEAVEQPATETSQHCWTVSAAPLVAMDRVENSRDG